MDGCREAFVNVAAEVLDCAERDGGIVKVEYLLRGLADPKGVSVVGVVIVITATRSRSRIMRRQI